MRAVMASSADVDASSGSASTGAARRARAPARSLTEQVGSEAPTRLLPTRR